MQRLCYQYLSVWVGHRGIRLTGPWLIVGLLENSDHHLPLLENDLHPISVVHCPCHPWMPETAGFVSVCLTLKISQPHYNGCFIPTNAIMNIQSLTHILKHTASSMQYGTNLHQLPWGGIALLTLYMNLHLLKELQMIISIILFTEALWGQKIIGLG